MFQKNGFSEKIYLQLEPPTEEAPISDQRRIEQALYEMDYSPVTMPLSVIRKLYPLCRECGFAITVTLVYRETHWIITDVEAGDTRNTHYGLAVDYGSTTIVMQLVDMNTQKVLAQAREFNGQIAYGTDILTRITYTLEHASHIDDMHRVTVETFQRLFTALSEETGIHVRRCPILILSGNTTMIHFLLKLNAWTVFASPYAPVTADPGWFWGSELGMDFEGLIYIIPAASNYVGGDIISGLLELQIHKQDGIQMFFDIGTNGELVIGNRDWMVAGAGAAGPALEGYISRYGTRAADGVIDHIQINGAQLSYTTIGQQAPHGICGSGIIDLLAEMRKNGWINIAGELNPEATGQIIYLEEEQQYAAVYATAEESAIGSPLFFTQTDIRQYLETKAAAYTMIECMLEATGCLESDLDHCYLSGAFPAHSNLESAITIGIFPDLPREKYSCISNTSLKGARLLLLDRDLLKDVYQLSTSMYCIQFASIPDFIIRMQAAKFIPHTDMERYPSVKF